MSFMLITGCSSYKPLSRGALVNAKIAVVYDINWTVDTRGLFGGLIALGVVSGMITDLMKANFSLITTKMTESIKENLSTIAPEIVIEESAIFYTKKVDESNDKEKIFRKLLSQGYTHVLTFDINLHYVHKTTGGADFLRLDYVTKISNLRTQGELFDFKIFPEFLFETKNEDNYSMKDQILSEKENSPRLFLKTVVAGLKYLNKKLFQSLKTGKQPVVHDKYNCEKFLRTMGMYSTIN